MDNIEKNKMRDIVFAVIIHCLIAIYVIMQNIEIVNSEAIIFDVLFILLYGIAFLLYKYKINKKIFAGIIVIVLIVLNIINLSNNSKYCIDVLAKEASIMDQDTYSLMINSTNKIIDNLKKYDDSLYRVEKDYKVSVNDATTFGYNGVSFSGSTYSKSTHEFLKKLGIRMSHVHIYYNGESTKTVDMLLGIKYFIIPQYYNNFKNYEIEYEDLFMVNNMKICKNPYYLALGYSVNEEIDNIELKSNTFEYQNQLLKNITGIDEDVYARYDGEIKSTTVDIVNEEEKEDVKLIYEFIVYDEKNLYSYILLDDDDYIKMYINEEEAKKNHTCNETVSFGKRNIGDKIRIEVISDKEISVKDIFVYYEDEEVLKKHYEKISKEQVNMTKINNSEYKGKINVNKDNQCILFTFPYDEGWQVFVDGKQVEYEKALDALIMIRVQEGEHELVLKYLPPKIHIGIIMSVIGGILLLFNCFIFKNREAL